MGGGPRIDTTEDEIGERGKLPAAGATRTTEKKNRSVKVPKSDKRSAQQRMGDLLSNSQQRHTQTRGGGRGDHSTGS